jgi:hypothetical protein
MFIERSLTSLSQSKFFVKTFFGIFWEISEKVRIDILKKHFFRDLFYIASAACRFEGRLRPPIQKGILCISQKVFLGYNREGEKAEKH